MMTPRTRGWGRRRVVQYTCTACGVKSARFGVRNLDENGETVKSWGDWLTDIHNGVAHPDAIPHCRWRDEPQGPACWNVGACGCAVIPTDNQESA